MAENREAIVSEAADGSRETVADKDPSFASRESSIVEPAPQTSHFKKTANFAGLVVIGGAILFFGFQKIKNQIASPFAEFKASRAGSSALAIGQSSLADNLDPDAALKNRDTDKDGLSDYDETKIYYTSPYLDDSDSDGYTDKEEIDTSHDPNCPSGQTCAGSNPAGGADAGETASAENASQISALPEGFNSMEELRQVWEKSGIPKATLDQIDDNSLIELYNQTIKETGANPFIPADGQTAAGSPEETIGQMSPDEVRQAMIDDGIDPKMLEGVSDEELMKMVSEAIKNAPPASSDTQATE